jgi:hypothetical protein
MKVKFTLSIGFAGGKHASVEEFDDDITDEELDEAYQEWCTNYLNGGWVRLEEQ